MGFGIVLDDFGKPVDVVRCRRGRAEFRVIKIQCAFLQTVEDRTLRTGAIPG
jgi:EAL domain-containing protein (putative c-di-GMP-specific phosphodiesterase class I)